MSRSGREFRKVLCSKVGKKTCKIVEASSAIVTCGFLLSGNKEIGLVLFLSVPMDGDVFSKVLWDHHAGSERFGITPIGCGPGCLAKEMMHIAMPMPAHQKKGLMRGVS